MTDLSGDALSVYKLIDLRKRQHLDAVARAMAVELDLQGHTDTGALANSFEVVTYNPTTGAVLALAYVRQVDRGVDAVAVRGMITLGSRTQRNRYVQAIAAWVRRKLGVPPARQYQVAWAIIRKHMREGIPTRASRRFSKTGKRTGFVGDAVRKVGEPEVEAWIGQALERFPLNR